VIRFGAAPTFVPTHYLKWLLRKSTEFGIARELHLVPDLGWLQTCDRNRNRVETIAAVAQDENYMQS